MLSNPIEANPIEAKSIEELDEWFEYYLIDRNEYERQLAALKGMPSLDYNTLGMDKNVQSDSESDSLIGKNENQLEGRISPPHR